MEKHILWSSSKILPNQGSNKSFYSCFAMTSSKIKNDVIISSQLLESLIFSILPKLYVNTPQVIKVIETQSMERLLRLICLNAYQPIFPYHATDNVQTSQANNSSTIGPNELQFDKEAQCSVHRDILYFGTDRSGLA